MNESTELSPWPFGRFSPPRRILENVPHVSFTCPVTGQPTAWAAKDVFNPGAVVRDGRVCLLVRAEDGVKRYAGVSRIGLATSGDGVNFELEPEPVLYPDNDRWQAWEWPGGCEDPRVVESPDGGYVCTYTAFDGKCACLFIATSDDLRRWEKHGPAFAGTPYVRRPSKSGALVTELRDGRLVAARIEGKFWMYWGEGTIFAATSDDLIRWAPVEIDAAPDSYLTWRPENERGRSGWQVDHVPGPTALRPIAGPRRRRFDSWLTEPGPPALLTDAGVTLIYNGVNHPTHGHPSLPAHAYHPGLLRLDRAEPSAVVTRADAHFLGIDAAEADGQIRNVCFAEGLVAFQGQWRLYLGLADSRIGVATTPINPPAEGRQDDRSA
jgi:predicted GH43/DUF377 family glycosyl hydrolase